MCKYKFSILSPACSPQLAAREASSASTSFHTFASPNSLRLRGHRACLLNALKLMFGDRIRRCWDSLTSDMILAALMLRYNQRKVG